MKLVILYVLLAMATAAPVPEDEEAPVTVALLRDVRVQPDALGAHSSDFEAANGIVFRFSGTQGPLGGSNMEGSFNYRLDDGTFVPLTFVANVGGYQPQSELLPVAPLPLHPVPQHALDQIAFAEEQSRLQTEEADEES